MKEGNPALIASGLTALQKMGLRNAQPHVLLTVGGESAPDTPVLNCPGNVTRVLVAKGLAVHGAKIGPANATVLTGLGEDVRAAIMNQND